MGYAEHKLKEIKTKWNERKKTARLRLMTMDDPFIYSLIGPITESEPTVCISIRDNKLYWRDAECSEIHNRAEDCSKCVVLLIRQGGQRFAVKLEEHRRILVSHGFNKFH